MSYGGKGIFDWSPTGLKRISVIGTDVDLAKHEFGHSLGLGDTYRLHYIWKVYEGPGANPNYAEYVNWPTSTSTAPEKVGLPNSVMNDNGPIMNNDI